MLVFWHMGFVFLSRHLSFLTEFDGFSLVFKSLLTIFFMSGYRIKTYNLAENICI